MIFGPFALLRVSGLVDVRLYRVAKRGDCPLSEFKCCRPDLKKTSNEKTKKGGRTTTFLDCTTTKRLCQIEKIIWPQ